LLPEKLNAPLVFAAHDIQQTTAAYALAFRVIGVWQKSSTGFYGQVQTNASE
jgi:hypothetical protein